MTDAEALERVLQRFDGVIVGPSATVDAQRELSAPTETGHLRIDDVRSRPRDAVPLPRAPSPAGEVDQERQAGRERKR